MTSAATQGHTAHTNGGRPAEGTLEQSPTLSNHERLAAQAPMAEQGMRTMPENVRKHVITLRDGKHYLPSAFRVLWFRMDHPDWSIVTELIEGGFQAGWATVRASVISDDGRVIATGMKTESKGDFPAGWVEKAETGAVGRALAMAGYGTQFAPELYEGDEEAKPASTRAVTRSQAHAIRRTPQNAAKIWTGPGLCPNCHAPEGKPHSRKCTSAR